MTNAIDSGLTIHIIYIWVINYRKSMDWVSRTIVTTTMCTYKVDYNKLLTTTIYSGSVGKGKYI